VEPQRDFGSHLNTQQRLAKLTVAEGIFKREYHRLIDALAALPIA